MAKTKGVLHSSGSENKSPFRKLTKSFYLTLSPAIYNFPVEGLCAEHISPHLLSYYPPLHGVLLSYDNARITEDPAEASLPTPPPEVLAQSIGEYGVSYVWLTCDFLIFRPERGTVLDGTVNLQSESVLGLICYNYFNAAIDREKLPSGWTWDGEQWLDRKGKSVAQRSFSFQVEDFEATGVDSISITGTLL